MAPIGPLNNSVCSRWVIIFPPIEGRIAINLFKHFDLDNTFTKENCVSINLSKLSLGLLTISSGIGCTPDFETFLIKNIFWVSSMFERVKKEPKEETKKKAKAEDSTKETKCENRDKIKK